MPVEVKKIRCKNLYPKGASPRYQVKNPDTGKVHAKGTTKEKAEAQARLLNAIYLKEPSACFAQASSGYAKEKSSKKK